MYLCSLIIFDSYFYYLQLIKDFDPLTGSLRRKVPDVSTYGFPSVDSRVLYVRGPGDFCPYSVSDYRSFLPLSDVSSINTLRVR